MANKRDLRLHKYGISKYRYRELRNFCLQYGEWRDKLKHETNTLKSSQITDMPISKNISDSTSDLAIKRIPWQDKCEVIEQTMILAITTLEKGNTNKLVYDGDYQDLYKHMIMAVTEDGITYNFLSSEKMKPPIPIGRDSFNMMRRYFYFLLDKNKSPYV